jgi:hypothetical protein
MGRRRKKKQEVDEEILRLISDPNWTPEKEDEWLSQPAEELARRFPPMTKPMHVKRRKGGTGWGG